MNNASAVPFARGEERLYYEGLTRREVLFQRCRACGAAIWYLRTVCPSCMSADLEVATSRGHGRLYSFTVLYRAGSPDRESEVPYALGLVDLDEGVRVLGNLASVPDGPAAIGAPAHVGFTESVEGSTLLSFIVDED